MINRNTRVIVPVIKGQCRFALEEALKYCAAEYGYSMLADTLICNIPLREELRQIGINAFVQELKDILPENDSLAEDLDEFAERYADKPLGNVDIQLYSINDDFTLLGHTFHGLQELKDREEMYASESHTGINCYSLEGTYTAPHVGELYEDYPCFDSYDYASERRTYQNYIIRKKTISEEDLKKVHEAPGRSSLEKTVEDMPLDILPLVYYKGDGRYIKVATRKE